MKNYKLIILGPQCSGKTTLVRYLREYNSDLPIREEEEIFMEMNNGVYPENVDYKETNLRPKLNEQLLQYDNLVFLTSYCNPVLLNELKSKGFKIILLRLDQDEFQKRNENRMREQGYPDANVWAKEIFSFHDRIVNDSVIDLVIDATLPTKEIAKQIIDLAR